MKTILQILTVMLAMMFIPTYSFGQSKSSARNKQQTRKSTMSRNTNVQTRTSKSTNQKSQTLKVSDATGKSGEYGYVDLGLPSRTLWGRCNVGATFPKDFGFHYSWGGTRPYFRDECKTCGLDIDDIAGNPEYDVACRDWGKSWTMPTNLQWEELIEKCKWQWINSSDGAVGYKVTGINGNSIFLPAAGWTDNSYNGDIPDHHKIGHYWSSSSYPGDRVLVLKFDSKSHEVFWDYRSQGYSVRPVTKITSEFENNK